MPKFTVRGSNMWANYTIGQYEAQDEVEAMNLARRDVGSSLLVGLQLRAELSKADRAGSPQGGQ